MHKALLGGLASLLVALSAQSTATAQTSEPLKPYILFIADVSGSMAEATNHGSPSCAPGDTRLNHLKCALGNIVNGYGDMVMGLGRYRQTTTDTNPTTGCYTQGVDCEACNSNSANCTPAMGSGDRFELLVPLVDANQSDLLEWVDFTTGTCFNDQAANPELDDGGWTPIAGSLEGAKRYWQGLNTPGIDTTVGVVPYWTGPGAEPIRDDPLKNVFIGGEQCRPYIVIMLTDGDETCVPNVSETRDAAASLLTTDVDGQTYRIRTKPIGFGKTPGDTDIEALAHAGGTPNGPGFEGYYAQNEEELALAISQIISEALKFETCNDLDDDCDILIDEDFPAKNSACDDGQFGICRGTGIFQCAANGGLECVLDNPGLPATPETCNGLDDDCDAKVDEGQVCQGCGTVEFCDGLDNDCDGAIDENITRPCGSNVGECTAGTEVCVNGGFEGCTAIGGSAEICDGLDNDCDGTIDGFAQTCTEIPGNNPGVGVCQSGVQVCPSDGSGVFGPCIGEIGPSAESCDLLDNDCDVLVDEDTGGDSCNGSCGVGITQCSSGVIECESLVVPSDEVCDGIDNDCDTITDESVPEGAPCDTNANGMLCEPGMEMCVNGTYQCIGGVEPEPEVCDCLDNDCDGQSDEEPPALCPTGTACVSCQCASPCQGGEFPCPPGLYCSPEDYCLVDPCFGVVCEPTQDGDQTECVAGACVPSCDLITCPADYVCIRSQGQCAPDNCLTFPERCAADELCVAGECLSDPCAQVSCPAGQYCLAGDCVTSCAEISCPDGQSCVLGQCQANPCVGVECPPFQVCSEMAGQCGPDPCLGTTCQPGRVCNQQTGDCEIDPCLGVTCPEENQICVGGSCYVPPADAGPDYDYVSPGGGGDGCNAGGGLGLGGLLGLLALLVLIRRREGENA